MAGSTNVATLTAKLTADTSGLKRGFGQADRELKGFSGRSAAVMKGLGTAAVAGAAVAGAALVGAAVKGVAAFADFEKGMNEVFTLLPDITEDAMGDMEKEVKDFSKKFGVLPDKVIPSLYQAISAGVPKDNVFEFMEVATKASIGGATELETAVDGLTSVVNAYGAENITAAEASDLMFTSVRLGKTTMDELSRSLFQVNPVAAAMGVNFGDVSAAMAAMTAQGTPTRVATTQLRQAFVELGKEGTVAFDAFKDATGQTFPDFIAGGGNVEEAFRAMKDKADEMGVGVGDLFGSVEAGMGVISLTSESGAEAFGKAMSEMQDSAGATDAAFDTMDQGLARSWDKIKAQFSTALIDIGGKIAPFAEDFATWFGDVMPSAIDKVMAAFDTVIGVAQDFVTGVSVIRDWVTSLPGMSDKAVIAIGAIGLALMALYANPIIAGLGLVAAAIVAIGEQAKEAKTRLKKLEDVADGVIDADFIRGEIGDSIDELTDLGFSIGEISTALRGTDADWDRFYTKARNASGSLIDMPEAVGKIHQLRTAVQKTVPKVSDLSDEMLELKRSSKRTTDKVVPDITEMAELYAEFADGMAMNTSDVASALEDSATDFDRWEAELGDSAQGMADDMFESVSSIVNMWAGAPDQIEISVDEMIANLMETANARDEYEALWRELMNRGLYGLADELAKQGPAATDAIGALAADGAAAWQAEFLLDPTAELRALSSPSQLGLARDAGYYLGRKTAEGYDAGFGQPTVTVTSTGADVRLNQPRFHTGGIVPGTPGTDVPAILQAGEQVIPANQVGTGSGGVTIVVEGNLFGAATVDDLADLLTDAQVDQTRRGY